VGWAGCPSLYSIYSRRKKEEGRRKKEEEVIAKVSAIKNVLTVLAVAYSRQPETGFDGRKYFVTACRYGKKPGYQKIGFKTPSF
jgi:hypothetical protein